MLPFLLLLLLPEFAFADMTQLAADTAVKELTGVMGVLSDTQKIGVATVTIAILPYAFGRLRSMLR